MQETLAALEQAAERTNGEVIVSFSGGKDSLVVLDLALRHFKRVECFFMYLLPGLECCELMLEWARREFGVTIHQYPHWIVGNFIRNGVYCFNHWSHDDLPEWKLRNIYDLVIADLGIPLIATGAKAADGQWRRRQLAKVETYGDILNPVKGWSLFDILAYIKARGIPKPPGDGNKASGVDLSPSALLWLYRDYPRDFARLAKVFPFIEAVIWRNRWYGEDEA